MNAAARRLEPIAARNSPKLGFLRWQCRVRQLIARNRAGRPDDGIMPLVTLQGQTMPMGSIITILSKRPEHSKTPELQHLARQTHDPAKRREKALQLLCETYYQRADEFSDVLTATFEADSAGAKAIEAAGECVLNFEAYGQHFELACSVSRLAPDHWQHQATWWHNFLFKPEFAGRDHRARLHA